MKRSITYVAGGILVALVAWGGTAAAAQWANPELLASADEVKKGMAKGNWVVVDCRDLKAYAKGHIPGAISFGNAARRLFETPRRGFSGTPRSMKNFSARWV